MNPTFRFALSVLIGVSVGVASARYLTSTTNSVVRERHGNWFSWPSAGHPNSSPYSLARYLLDGSVPEHFSEVLTFYRHHDEDGGRLSSGCLYQLSMDRPGARRWSISVSSPGGKQSAVLTQDDVISRSGKVLVLLSAHAQPGNWLKLQNDGDQELTLRLYDGETILDQAKGGISLPVVSRESCS